MIIKIPIVHWLFMIVFCTCTGALLPSNDTNQCIIEMEKIALTHGESQEKIPRVPLVRKKSEHLDLNIPNERITLFRRRAITLRPFSTNELKDAARYFLSHKLITKDTTNEIVEHNQAAVIPETLRTVDDEVVSFLIAAFHYTLNECIGDTERPVLPSIQQELTIENVLSECSLLAPSLETVEDGVHKSLAPVAIRTLQKTVAKLNKKVEEAHHIIALIKKNNTKNCCGYIKITWDIASPFVWSGISSLATILITKYIGGSSCPTCPTCSAYSK